MQQNSVTKLFIHNPNHDEILSKFDGKFDFGAIIKMPDEVKKLHHLECDILSRMHPNTAIPLYYFLSNRCSIDPHILVSDQSKHKYFDAELSELEEYFYKLEDDISVSIPHMLPQDCELLFELGESICLVTDNYSVSTSRQWCEKFWGKRYDAFDSAIQDNRIQFKTIGSAPFELLEKWISENKITCDIGNIQDDFEYWSFSSYENGVLVKREDTLESSLLKVLMMVEEEKPKAQRFKQIHRDCFDEKISKQLLATYLNGEVYPFL